MPKKEKRSRRIRLKNYSVPVVVTGLIILQFFSPGRPWDLLLAALGSGLVLSILWAFSLLWGITFNRESQQIWAQVGDTFSEQFTISNKGPFPALAVTVIDYSHFPGHNSNVARPVIGSEKQVWFMDNIFYQRGLYNIGPTEILATDPFGIFEVTIYSPRNQEILITPPIIPLKQVDVASGDWHGDGGEKSRSVLRAVTAASVREYSAGDSLFSIHWLTSARRGDYYVRKYDQQPSSDWWIILDMDQSVHLGEGLYSTEEYAAVLTASIADRGLKENRAVGLLCEGGKQIWLPPKTGSGQRAEIMRSLALANQGNTSLRDLLGKAQRNIGRKSSMIIITPSGKPDWLPPLTTLKQRGVTTTVLLLNQEDFGGTQSNSPTLQQLATWGIRSYLIDKSIYAQPKIQEFFPRQMRVSPFSSLYSGRGKK